MLLDQPGAEIGILGREPMLSTKAPSIVAAQVRVIAAASLGDVMKEPRNIQKLGLRKIGNQPRAQRILMGMLRLGEAAQVAHHHQAMLVDRVDME